MGNYGVGMFVGVGVGIILGTFLAGIYYTVDNKVISDEQYEAIQTYCTENYGEIEVDVYEIMCE